MRAASIGTEPRTPTGWRARLAAGVAAVGLTLAVAAVPAGTVESTGPRAPVATLYAALLDVMKQAKTLEFSGRYAALEPVLASAYDMDFMAAKALGRHWKKLGEQERARWVLLFRRLIVSTYADRFDGFSGESFEIVGDEPSARETIIVHTRIHRSDDVPVELDYRVRSRVGDTYRVIDVYLNGTVSELALRRSDYSSLIKREGFAALVSAVQEKIAEAEAGTTEESL